MRITIATLLIALFTFTGFGQSGESSSKGLVLGVNYTISNEWNARFDKENYANEFYTGAGLITNMGYGIDAGKQVTKRLALFSGLKYGAWKMFGNYPMLCIYPSKPKLMHYWAVPLKARYQLLNGRLGVYTEVGVEGAAHFIKPYYDNKKQSEKAFGLSGMASLGLNFNVNANIQLNLAGNVGHTLFNNDVLRIGRNGISAGILFNLYP